MAWMAPAGQQSRHRRRRPAGARAGRQPVVRQHPGHSDSQTRALRLICYNISCTSLDGCLNCKHQNVDARVCRAKSSRQSSPQRSPTWPGS